MLIPSIGSIIKIDNLVFEMKLKAFENAGEAIEPSTSSVSDPSQCSGLALSDWVERFRDIGELLAVYKQLVEKDVESIRQAQKSLNDADKDRADKIKEVVGAAIGAATEAIKNSGGGSSGGSGGSESSASGKKSSKTSSKTSTGVSGAVAGVVTGVSGKGVAAAGVVTGVAGTGTPVSGAVAGAVAGAVKPGAAGVATGVAGAAKVAEGYASGVVVGGAVNGVASSAQAVFKSTTGSSGRGHSGGGGRSW